MQSHQEAQSGQDPRDCRVPQIQPALQGLSPSFSMQELRMSEDTDSIREYHGGEVLRWPGAWKKPLGYKTVPRFLLSHYPSPSHAPVHEPQKPAAFDSPTKVTSERTPGHTHRPPWSGYQGPDALDRKPWGCILTPVLQAKIFTGATCPPWFQAQPTPLRASLGVLG